MTNLLSHVSFFIGFFFIFIRNLHVVIEARPSPVPYLTALLPNKEDMIRLRDFNKPDDVDIEVRFLL